MTAAEISEIPVEPRGLRKQVNRVAGRNRKLEAQNDALVRLVLAARVRELDIDFAEGLDLLDSYRPDFIDDYELSFAPDAVMHYLATKRLP